MPFLLSVLKPFLLSACNNSGRKYGDAGPKARRDRACGARVPGRRPGPQARAEGRGRGRAREPIGRGEVVGA